MSTIAREPIDSPAAWRTEEMRDPAVWTVKLDPHQNDEIVRAVRLAGSSKKPLHALTVADFPLPGLAATARDWARVLDAGRGFVLVRGFPLALEPEEIERAYYGLGLHMGTPMTQNPAGDLLGHVRDLGVPRTGPQVRLYTTRDAQDFHTDGSDVVGLLCLQRARSGGLSRIVSSAAIYNEIVRVRPDLVQHLFEPMYFDRNDEQGADEAGHFAVPLCHVQERRFRMFYIGWYIRDAQRHPEVPRLSREQLELLNLIEQIAHDPRFFIDMDFQPGDIQFLKNATILHARTAYEDHAEPSRRRHLLRLWLTAHDATSVEGRSTRAR